MANLNKVLLICRLTRDAEVTNLRSGGKVANFGVAVNWRVKNQQTGEWEDQPTFIECKAWEGRADTISQYTRKGSQVYLEGHLRLEEWEAKDGGGKRSRMVVMVDNVQLLDPKSNGGGRQQSGGDSGYTEFRD